MKIDTLTSKEIEDFSSLFDLTPSIGILDLNNGSSDITTALDNFINPFEGTLTTLRTTILNELRVQLKKSNYDYGIICNSILDSSDARILMKMITLSIRDSGYIIILENKSKSLDIIYELLEECDFGAISSIDIFENYNLIMGKKLHMWGMD